MLTIRKTQENITQRNRQIKVNGHGKDKSQTEARKRTHQEKTENKKW